MNTRQGAIATISIVVLLVAIAASFTLSSSFEAKTSNDADTSLSSVTVNPNAKVSAEGYPLPSDAKEDVAISITDSSGDTDYSSGRILYDYDTGEWEVAVTDQFGLVNMVFAEDTYYVYDADNKNWFEVGAADAENVFDLSAVYFDESAVEGFLSASTFLGQVECGPGLCSAWQIVLSTDKGEGESIDTLTIRVENGTRKIYDVNAIGQSSSFTLKYTYQDVDIQPPSPIADDPNIEIINLDENGQVVPSTD